MNEPRPFESVRRRRAVFLCALLSTGSLAVPACRSVSHAEAKRQARQRWNDVRADIKQELAKQQYEGRLFEQAARTAAESLELNPKLGPAYVLLARSYLELGKTVAAEMVLQGALEAGIESPDIDYTRGVIEEQRGRSDTAVAFYARAQSATPANLDYLVALAECLVSLNRASEAQTVLYKNAQRVDDDGTVAVLRAHVASLLGKNDEAVTHLRDALAKHPTSRLIRGELGRLLVGQERFAEALGVLEPLVHGPVDTAGLTNATRRALATAYLGVGDPLSARNLLLGYVKTNPGDAMAQLLLAKAALAVDDMLTAMRAIDAARRQAPNEPELKLVRAAVRWKRRDLAGAVDDLRDVLNDRPSDVQAHCLLAEILAEQAKPSAAAYQFGLALKLDPTCDWASEGLDVAQRNVRKTSDQRRTPQ